LPGSRLRRPTLLATAGWALFGVLSPAGAQAPAIAVQGTNASTAAAIAAAATATVDPNALLLFEVHLNNLTLTDGLAAYGAPEDPLIPVGEFTRLLELDVDVSPTEGRVVGRIGEAQRSLLVDLTSHVARIGSQQVALSPEDVAVSPNDIYLRASALLRLLPIKLVVDTPSLMISVTSTELLPVESRLRRQATIARGFQNGGQEPVLHVDTPYRGFSMPSFDVAIGTGAQSNGPHVPFRYDVRAGADLLGANLIAYVGSQENGKPNTVRATLERRSLTGDLLGPFKARVADVGDVYSPTLPIGPRSIAGRGVFFSSVPLDQTSIFNRIDLRGELPLGDDVELYVNDVLIAGQSAPAQGRYEFLNVPLTSGLNVVRIVSYGQRGERKEETRVINVGGGLLRRGETTFEFGALDQDQPLIRAGPFQVAAGAGGFARGDRLVASLNYGVTQFLTLSAGAANYAPRSGEQRQMAMVGARTSLLGFATQFDVAANTDGGSGATVAAAGRVLGMSTVLRHSEYRGGFFDENNLAADTTRDARRRTELSINGNLPIGRRILPVSLQGFRDQYTDGATRLTGHLQFSSVIGPVLYSTGLDYERTDNRLGPPTRQIAGYLAGSIYRDYVWQIRGMLDYEFVPDARVRDLSLNVDRDINEDLAVRFGVTQQLEQRKGQSFFASGIRRTRFGDLALTSGYDTGSRAWQLGLQLNFGLAWDENANRYKVARPGPGAGGSVVLHAFIDANGDGAFNSGEAPVPNVLVEGGDRPAITGADGRAFVTGLGTAPVARVTVGVDRIENAMVKTPPTAIEFSPRPGAVTVVEYPIQPTGEVVVKVMLARPDGGHVGLSAVQVQLVNDRGGVVDAITEFDGSVVFQDLPIGHYRLQLAPEQSARLRMRLLQQAAFVVHGNGEATPDVTVEVAFQPR
jgi:hypothetical protein